MPSIAPASARTIGALAAAGALALSASASPASAADRMFWSDYGSGTIGAANLDGANAGDAVGSAGAYPFGIVVDSANEKIYWVEQDAGEIRYAGLDGSAPGVLDIGSAYVGYPNGLTLDPGAGTVYWADRDIYYAKTTGGVGGVFLARGAITASGSQATAAVVEPEQGKIYWTDAGTGKIGVANLDGTGTPSAFALTGSCTQVASGYGLQVDFPSNSLYLFGYTAGGSAWIGVQARLDGSGCSDLISGSGTVYGAALDPAGNRLIYPAYDTGGIRFQDLAAGGVNGAIPVAPASAVNPGYVAIMATPAASVAPRVVPSTASPGSVLTCTAPTWGPGKPGMQLFRSPAVASVNAFSWTRDGVSLPGANASITATEVGSYQCAAATTNAAGTGIAVSNTATVSAGTAPAPGPSAAAPTVNVKKTTRIVGRSKITLKSSVLVGEAGKITQKAVRRGGKKQTLCTASRKVNGPGTFSVTCTMGSKARNQLRSGAIKYTLVTKITTVSGASSSTSFSATLPRTR